MRFKAMRFKLQKNIFGGGKRIHNQQYGAFSRRTTGSVRIVGALPATVLFLLVQKRLISGLTQGAVKG